jgi:hypothetical protein
VARGPKLLAAATAVALACALPLSGCGGDDGGSGGAPAPAPVAKPEDFPKAEGKTLAQLRQEVAEAGGPVLAPSVSQLEPGRNRFGFGLFDRARAQIADARAVVYVAPTGGGAARGPFPARYESLKVSGPFQSRSVSDDPDSAGAVYVADVEFQRAGQYEVLGIVRLDERLVAATPAGPALRVVRDSSVPEVGERAPRIDTPTKDDVGGNVKEIDTRDPPSTMHEADFADVVGKKPAVLLFATAALCQSRVCGPVIDVTEEVKSKSGGGAEFVHMEIYRDNEIAKGFRPQVLRWRLPTEPWLFTVDRRGRIAAALEGAFSARELEAALRAARSG